MPTLAEIFSRACFELKQNNITFAVAGGIATVLYREENRLTEDADFAVSVNIGGHKLVEEILLRLGLDSIGVSHLAELEGGPLFAIKRRSSPVAMLIGRSSNLPKGSPGVDFLLSSLPWVKSALPRAEINQVDFGFGEVPTLTLEDVIISKLFARKGKYRPKDEDDLLSVFAANPKMDFDYLNSQMHKLELLVPKTIVKDAPVLLQKISKDVAKLMRRKSITR